MDLDAHGFVLTGTAVHTGGRWQAVNGTTTNLMTGVEGVFEVGDVRAASMKRVATAVGESESVSKLDGPLLDQFKG
ncbi:hypothetical protein [Paraburkholderia steynii]|uniref:hypothetical protein n=1 Tax=Paraburkholderia steynii TaxID=1245441 RepID=UPI00115FC8B3|nr:hypothetical protein [Paraburkholderia steynii]